jgi:hypothetical protein
VWRLRYWGNLLEQEASRLKTAEQPGFVTRSWEVERAMRVLRMRAV